MTASRPDRRLARVLVALAALLTAGCRTAGAPPESPLELLPTRATIVPEPADYAAADLAASSLAGRRGAAAVMLLRLESIDAVRTVDGEGATGLAPYGRDVLNATSGDAREYRRAARELLARDDLDPPLRARLERVVEDDPLALADARLRDARWTSFARAFNAVVAPLSRAATSSYAAGVGLLRSLIGLAIVEHMEDELTRPERQALVHWKRFLEEHPDAPEAARIVERVEESQARWDRVQRDRALRSARRALETDQPRVALVQAQRALRYSPEDALARAILEASSTQLERQRVARRRSVAAEPDPRAALLPEAGRPLALALLGSADAVGAEAERLLAADPGGPLADEALFALALAQAEAGEERPAWETLEQIAGRDPERSNMARHALGLLHSPEQNPYWAFRETRAHDRGRRARWILLGPLMNGARDRELPRAVEWLIDLPSLIEALGSFPNRLIAYPWIAPWPFGRPPAAYARRYLERIPDGAHARELREWLLGHERRRGNWVAALPLAEALGRDADELADLREKAARQILEAARRTERRDLRASLYREVARDYVGTQAASEAGGLARQEVEQATPQRIRISRDFLRENPRLAGPEGLGLQPGLVDGELENGELHRSGVTLVGGTVIDLAFVAASGREGDEPVTLRRRVSSERLARLVALLDETALRSSLVDRDAHYGLDAGRERYFERARLGLAKQPDLRAAAQSTYAYRSMRERYGLVRSRESILPVELVVQGSLSSLSLGAFPRIRIPKPTPDAPLYE